MHLCYGGGTKWHFTERCEQLRQWGAQLKFDLCAYRVNSQRRQLVLQLFQLIDVGIRQQVAPHRQHLSKFEEGQPQLFEGLPDLFRRRPMTLAAQSTKELVS